MRRLHRARHVRSIDSEFEGDETELMEGEDGESIAEVDPDLHAKVAKIEQDRIDALRALGVWDDQ